MFPRSAFCVLAFAKHALASCSDHQDCGSCLDSTTVFTHTCYWCEIDQGCHTVGSSVSPCTPDVANEFCISKSSLSECSGKDTCATAGKKSPEQIHIALCGDDCMRVSWKTNGGKPNTIQVVYSTDFAADVGHVVPAERSLQYLASQGGHGWHHTSKLSGLQPGTTYHYRIVVDGVTSTEKSFKTLAAGQTDASFMVLADMGSKEDGQAIESRGRMEALKGSSDLVIHAGDIGYSDDAFLHGSCVAEFCYEAIYDGWMKWMENITDNLPYMVSAGNHESECHSPACQVSSDIKHSLANFSAYNARWSMPSAESGGAANMWYSFDYGSVHFVSINTETDFPGAGEENYGDAGGVFGQPAGHFGADGDYARWLEADLKKANANRAKRPWVVAFGHRPWFIKAGTTTDNSTRDAHANLFQKYGVDLYINGHWHAYHRMLPINGNDNTPSVTVGGAGCDEFAGDNKKNGIWDEKGKNDAWDYRYYNLDKTVSQMKVTATDLVFSTYASTNGDVIDTVKLTKASIGKIHV